MKATAFRVPAVRPAMKASRTHKITGNKIMSGSPSAQLQNVALKPIVIPQETNQEVPGWLTSMAARSGSFGSSKPRRGGGGSRFGGRDFRQDRGGGAYGGGGGGGYDAGCESSECLVLYMAQPTIQICNHTCCCPELARGREDNCLLYEFFPWKLAKQREYSAVETPPRSLIAASFACQGIKRVQMAVAMLTVAVAMVVATASQPVSLSSLPTISPVSMRSCALFMKLPFLC